MADKSSTSGAASGRAPAASEPGRIRNVVLVGHSGAGKTSLVEALLVATGTIPRAGRVEDGTTVSDFDEAEARQQRSISLAVAPLEVDGVKINLLDSPGYADFTGDLRAGLRAADAALFVVSAVDGIDGTTRMIWEECATVGMPRAVVITRLDSGRADFEQTLAACQDAFGDGVLPLYLPLHADEETIGGLIGLLSQQIFDYSGGTRSQRDPDPEHLPLIEEHRNALIEAVIAESEDESFDGPIPRRRGDRRQGPHRRPRDRGGARRLLPGAGDKRDDRTRDGRAARDPGQRIPVAARASAARRQSPGRFRGRAADV
jgi:elongation factor G